MIAASQPDTPPATASPERLVVVVPCMNEEDNVRGTVATIQRVARSLPAQGIDVEVSVLLVDDGSTDGTRDAIAALCAENADCSAMINEKNLGVGRSLLLAYERIPPGTWVTIMPGDNEIDFSSIRGFLAMRHDFDLILGYLQNPVIRPLGRRLASVAYMRTVRVIYGLPFKYLNGMKLFRVDVFAGIRVEAAGHAFNSELIAKAMLRNPALRIGEAPFVAYGRPTGLSKAIRPRSVAQAVLEVGRGWRSVAEYREQIIKNTPR